MQNNQINGKPKRAPDFVIGYAPKEFEGNKYYEVTAKQIGSTEEPLIVAHFFEENAAKTCCVRYNLHEQLMKICLFAGVTRAKQRMYEKERNIVANAQRKQAEKELDEAILAVQKM